MGDTQQTPFNPLAPALPGTHHSPPPAPSTREHTHTQRQAQTEALSHTILPSLHGPLFPEAPFFPCTQGWLLANLAFPG